MGVVLSLTSTGLLKERVLRPICRLSISTWISTLMLQQQYQSIEDTAVINQQLAVCCLH